MYKTQGRTWAPAGASALCAGPGSDRGRKAAAAAAAPWGHWGISAAAWGGSV